MGFGGESSVVDAIWISEKYGIVIFDLVEGDVCDDRSQIKDEVFYKIRSKLGQYPKLNIKREFAVSMNVITYAPAVHSRNDDIFSDINLLPEIERIEDWDHPELFSNVLSVIQSVVNLKEETKRDILVPGSRGDKILTLEKTLANLDGQQERAVVEYRDGPQRIRGLAGSGKTIVLALKAAYLHVLHPEWDICVTFNTRSLKEQFKKLISKFCANQAGDTPNWEKIKIIHAWGGVKSEGVYSEVCKEHGLEFFDLSKARNSKILNRANELEFDYVCKKANEEIRGRDKDGFKKMYDVILIDEAQDLPESFLQLCFNVLGTPKRIIYAYDELQNLNKGESLQSPLDIFGVEAQDTILKKCYRNSRPLLVTAHALGFGIYREGGMVQFFDRPQLWQELGYSEKNGLQLNPGANVCLLRTNDNSPLYLQQHSTIEDILIFKKFDTIDQQSKWIAREIENNIKNEELKYSDIVVINPNAITTKKEITSIRSILQGIGISSHIAGEIDSDIFFQEKSITFTGINRAKGNESAMVYIINAQDCYSNEKLEDNKSLLKKRNILFTAITRSKAWVRVCGIGERMDKLIEEYEKVKAHNFELNFSYPTSQEIQEMNLIHRDFSSEESAKISSDVGAMSDTLDVIRRIKQGDAFIEDYPEELQIFLKKIIHDQENNKTD